MFLTTPLVCFTVNSLYRKGSLTKGQRDGLIVQDRRMNTVITVVFIVLAVAYVMQ